VISFVPVFNFTISNYFDQFCRFMKFAQFITSCFSYQVMDHIIEVVIMIDVKIWNLLDFIYILMLPMILILLNKLNLLNGYLKLERSCSYNSTISNMIRLPDSVFDREFIGIGRSVRWIETERCFGNADHETWCNSYTHAAHHANIVLLFKFRNRNVTHLSVRHHS